MFLNCSLELKSLLAWTLRGPSFCPQKVIAPILFDPFLAQVFHMTLVFDWSYFMSVLSENDRDSFLCTASFFVQVLFSLIGDVYIVLEGGPEVAAQVTLAKMIHKSDSDCSSSYRHIVKRQ